MQSGDEISYVSFRDDKGTMQIGGRRETLGEELQIEVLTVSRACGDGGSLYRGESPVQGRHPPNRYPCVPGRWVIGCDLHQR